MSTDSPAAIRHVERCMGTVFSFDIRDPGVTGDALHRVLTWLHSIDAMFSTYRADSEICRLAAGALPFGECSPAVRDALDACERLRAETGGWFDAGAGGRLDPSGYVKGWAIERASEMLRAAGSLRHCVNGGGDVQVVGGTGTPRTAGAPGGIVAPRGTTPWRIGISDPHHSGELISALALIDGAVATSGSAERGQHILNPRTGRHADHFASVTVVGPSLTRADAYATAAAAMGAPAINWITQFEGYEILACEHGGRILESAGFLGAPSY
jgi:thiamine biosynthesis lipoprotein